MSGRATMTAATTTAVASATAKDRNWGIDLLRVVCMVMIPVLHVCNHGGILSELQPLTIRYEVAWLMEAAAYCAVDCYALISGYVGYGSRHRTSGLVSLCMQALFYTVGWTVILFFMHPTEVGKEDFFIALLPFTGVYWYLAAYFCLHFFMPYLDRMVRGLSSKNVRKLMIAIVLVFCALQTVLKLISSLFAVKSLFVDLLQMAGGYSFVWLAALYVLGACLKRENVTARSSRCVVVYLLCVGVMWGWKLFAEVLAAWFGIERLDPQVFYCYNSPTVVGCAVALLLLFLGLRLGKGLVVFTRFVAPLSFGVYLFHDMPLARNFFIKGAFKQYAHMNAIQMCLMVLVTALAIWLLGSLVDWVRARLFGLLHVPSFCEWLGGHVDSLLLPEVDEAQEQVG